MFIYSSLFYLFASLLVISSFAVVTVKHSVHAVFFLIFSFLNVSGLFVLLGAEFLAMTLVIVYVGAVAIFFLFIVMMIDSTDSADKVYIRRHRLFLSLLGLSFFIELVLIICSSLAINHGGIVASGIPMIMDGIKSNTHQIGLILYTDYGYLFQICGLILFSAIISSIVLTHRKSDKSNKRQNVRDQMLRNKNNSIILSNPKLRGGVDVVIDK